MDWGPLYVIQIIAIVFKRVQRTWVLPINITLSIKMFKTFCQGKGKRNTPEDLADAQALNGAAGQSQRRTNTIQSRRERRASLLHSLSEGVHRHSTGSARSVRGFREAAPLQEWIRTRASYLFYPCNVSNAFFLSYNVILPGTRIRTPWFLASIQWLRKIERQM